MSEKTYARDMRLPAYPLVTIDPFFSIWSRSDTLTAADTTLWTGHRKRIVGKVNAGGKEYTFLGKGDNPLPQRLRTVDFTETVYIFGNAEIELTARFRGAHVLDKPELLFAPVSYIDIEVKSIGGSALDVGVTIEIHDEIAKKNALAPCVFRKGKTDCAEFVSVRKKDARPLAYSGDHVVADWGEYFIAGDVCGCRKRIYGSLIYSKSEGCAASGKPFRAYFLLGADDGYSLEYFGKKLKGAWTKYYKDIPELVTRFIGERAAVYAQTEAFSLRLDEDSRQFPPAYAKILRAAFRQVVAAHKAAFDDEGGLLYFSKECHSNGCMNTVDVSYPSTPLFLMYNPELALGMLRGIFAFASSTVWRYGFAPHDIGRYPIGNGQVYGFKRRAAFNRDNSLKIFALTGDVYDYSSQMPIEECGNMLIMSYAYIRFGGKAENIAPYIDILGKWADYLVEKGVVLENQLCTDDFAGHSEKNVNLAVKSVIGIACFERLKEACSYTAASSDYFAVARDYAEELTRLARKEDGSLAFSLDKKDSWSLKYNLVWDRIFGFGLFDEKIYAAESAVYIEKLNKYGLPLDYRADFCKTDWTMYSSIFGGEKTVGLFAESLCAYLTDTPDRNPFSDYTDSVKCRDKGMNHRSVQGGLWIPALAQKVGAL